MIVNGEVYLSPPLHRPPNAAGLPPLATRCNPLQPHRDDETALGSLLARSWALLRRSSDAIGRSWDTLGRSWALLFDTNHSKTAPKSDFKGSWFDLELILVDLKSILECPGPSKSSSRAGELLIFMFFQFQLSTGTFGSTWSVLGASWAQLGRSWAPLGFNLDALGANLDAPGATLVALGANLDALGANLDALGVNLSSVDRPGIISATPKTLPEPPESKL